MMNPVDKDYTSGLHRPYTSNTFKVKLGKFEDLIANLTQQDSEASAEERRQVINKTLRFDAFCDSIRLLFGPDIKSNDLKAIFKKISSNPDAKVDWSELFGYFQSENEENDQLLREEVSVFTVSQKQRIGEASGDKKRRDIIQSVVHNAQLDIYIAASQKGALSVWSGKNLRLQGCADVKESSWVTGVDYLPGLRKITVSTERSFALWDYRAKGKNQNIFCIKPIDNSVQCMSYVPHSNNLHEDSILYGDDLGYLSLMTIAAKDLNTKNAKVDKKNGNLLLEPSDLSYPVCKRKLHDNWVLKVKYFPELRCFASCSASSNVSFILEDVNRLFDNQPCRSFGIPKGVNCFAYCARANIITTGGNDKIVRIWHPHIFSRPTGKMIGHLFTIIDLVVNEKDQHVISLSTARVFRIWDIHTLTSLQVFTDNEERPGEKRIHCMWFDEKHERLITGSSVLDLWPLTRTVQDTMQVPHTHDRPIVQLLYNQELNQVVTVCSESILKVWELETGKSVYSVSDAHGTNIEITAIAVDSTGYRLASGAVDGSVKVWDFGSGQEIRMWNTNSTNEDDSSIVGLQYCDVNGHRCILASGWNNKICLLEDNQESRELIVYLEFSDFYQQPMTPSNFEGSFNPVNSFSKSSPLPSISNAQITSLYKKDHVLQYNEMSCIACNPPQHMVAGCTNGNLILWNLTDGTVSKLFHLHNLPSGNRSSHRSKNMYPRHIAMVTFLVHKTRRPDPAYIKKLTGLVNGATPSNMDDKTGEEDITVQDPADLGIIETVQYEQDKEHEEHTEEANEQIIGEVNNEPDQEDDANNLETREPDTKPIVEDEDNSQNTIVNDSKSSTPNSLLKELDEENIDPNTKMLVSVFDPIIASCHADGFIRFWNLDGELLQECTSITKRLGSGITAICSDEDCNFLITGDSKGYINIWDVEAFLKNPKSEEHGLIKQEISWRAHLTRVASLVYIGSMQVIVSGSTDGSVRMWYGQEPQQGHFMGFFSQHRPWNFPNAERSSSPVLPYDISERPLKHSSNTNERRSKPGQAFRYPLIFKSDRWKPMRRSAYFQAQFKHTQPEDKKFFTALQKPLFYNDHLESFRTGEMQSGAVFRALPVYRVETPQRIQTPAFEFGSGWQGSSLQYQNSLKYRKASSPTKDLPKVKGPGSILARRQSKMFPNSTSLAAMGNASSTRKRSQFPYNSL
ncbi:WD repeat-containing protein 64-like isoform X2 [Anneissia japonica]|uniref:WD repeat-containing protein 64-like isoform X2 n=1 Tax=Anneissia japonica TaxID=1529436 RepID=UPI001425ACCE|nr:WD repeat-containing protein 64-like isoform X2 [Anneissia japonica]